MLAHPSNTPRRLVKGWWGYRKKVLLRDIVQRVEHPLNGGEVIMATIVGSEGGAGNDFVVSSTVALVITLLLKAGMIAIFSAAGLLLL